MTTSSRTKSASAFLRRAGWSAYLTFRRRDEARFPFKPWPAIERAQRRRLRRMLAHADRTVPYYRETLADLGLTPADFETAADLAKLPIIERDQIQRDPEYFVSDAEPLDEYLTLHSGGSSGAPRHVFHDGAAMLMGAAYFERIRSVMARVAGKRFGFREAVVVPPFSTFQLGHEFLERKRLVRSGALSERLYLSLLDPVDQNLRRLNEFKPDIVQGYGSFFELLFPYAHTTGAELHRPGVVVFYSDAMSGSARRLASETYGVPVLSVYGAIEAFHIGFECDRNVGYHLNADLVPLRLVDPEGRDVPQGESGDVIVSNLVNRATVLLNYRLGDVASFLPGACACGRTLPLLSFIEGRTDDWIESSSGEALHPQTVQSLFTDEEEIWQYQVEQVTPSRYRVAAVAADAADREAIRARLAEKFVRRIGAGTVIELTFVDAIPRTPGGKVRSVLAMRPAAPAVPTTDS